MLRQEPEFETALDRIELFPAEPDVQINACLPEKFADRIAACHSGHCAWVIGAPWNPTLHCRSVATLD
ncbi:MAG: hypothetical protein JWR70_3595 [Modestobacter sp.]|nr:hypothetical protein [Modestobacter sp.]